MGKAVIDAVAESRRITIMHEVDGKTLIESRQDCEHIVEAAKIIADTPPGKDFRHVGYIPETVLNQAFTEGWFHDQARWKQWLNDPDNRAFRTWEGRV